MVFEDRLTGQAGAVSGRGEAREGTELWSGRADSIPWSVGSCRRTVPGGDGAA